MSSTTDTLSKFEVIFETFSENGIYSFSYSLFYDFFLIKKNHFFLGSEYYSTYEKEKEKEGYIPCWHISYDVKVIQNCQITPPLYEVLE